MHFGRTGSIPLTRLQLPAHLSLSEAFLGAKLSRHRSDPPEPQRSGSLIHPDYHDTPPVRHFLHLRLQISFPAMAPPSPPLLRSPLMHVDNRQSPLYTPYFLSYPLPPDMTAPLTRARYRNRLESLHGPSRAIPFRRARLCNDQGRHGAIGIPGRPRIHLFGSVRAYAARTRHHYCAGGFCGGLPTYAGHCWDVLSRGQGKLLSFFFPRRRDGGEGGEGLIGNF